MPQNRKNEKLNTRRQDQTNYENEKNKNETP